MRWMRGYTARAAKRDSIAGVSLAAYVIPGSLAYASLADLPPVSGLYCYLVAGIAYALLGTSRQVAVGPTSSLAIVVGAGVATLAAGDPARGPALAAAVAIMLGLVACGGRLIGIGVLAHFLSDAVLTGFKTGAALYIASTQLPKLFGVAGASGNFFERMWQLALALPGTHVPSLLVGLAAIALFLGFARALPGRPTTLVVVVASIALMMAFHLADTGIKVVGSLPSGLPDLGVPAIDLADVTGLLPTALAAFLLAYAESISVARTFALKHGYEIDPDQELTALGASNIAAGLVHGFPVAGGMSQSAVNDMGGASSPAALLATSVVIALTLLFFAPLFHDLPQPVLGAVVLMAAKDLVRIEDLRRLRAVSRIEFRIALVAMGGVLLLGLLDGVLLAAAGSLIMLIARVSHPVIAVLERDPAGTGFVNRARYSGTVPTPGALVIRSAGAWLYFNAEFIRRHILDLVDRAAEPIRVVVIDFNLTPFVDVSAGTALRGLARALHERGAVVELAELRDDVVENLAAVDAARDIGAIAAHRTIDQCLVAHGAAPAVASMGRR